MKQKHHHSNTSLKTRSNALKTLVYFTLYPLTWAFKKLKRWYLKKKGGKDYEEDLSQHLPKNRL